MRQFWLSNGSNKLVSPRVVILSRPNGDLNVFHKYNNHVFHKNDDMKHN